MPAEPLYPLRFAPILKELIWGGRRLGTMLHKPIGAGTHYAESWEISDHRDDVSEVVEGPLAGTSLRTIVHERPEQLFGPGRTRSQFPLLVKFLDAHQVLSVQVHPNDELGRKLVGDNGKSEAWVVLHADPGSLIYAGLVAGTTREQFADALNAGAVEPLLHRFEPKPGDCIMIPAGTIHAIGAGVLLAEIQQMSDATFRVDDWGRVGADGKPRKLHHAEALESTDFEAGPVNPLKVTPEPVEGGTRERLARCPYFAFDRFRLTGPTALGSPDRFTIVVGLGGTARIANGSWTGRIEYGQTILLPAAIDACAVTPEGPATLLTCVVP
jgi:mannose-6-phosphate isomerase